VVVINPNNLEQVCNHIAEFVRGIDIKTLYMATEASKSAVDESR
jgi:hypothetical protein